MSLKVGDEVVIRGSSGRSLGVLVRETKTQYIVVALNPLSGVCQTTELRFNRVTWRRVGDSPWGTSFTLHELKPEDRVAFVTAYHKRDLRTSIVGTDWPKLSLAKLLEIKAIIERPEA